MDDSEPAEQTPDDIFLTAVLFESALGVLAIFFGWALGPDARAMVPELDIQSAWPVGNMESMWPIVSGILYGCLAAIPLLVFIAGIRQIPWEPIRELERLSDDGMIRSLLQLRPSEMIVISVCAGIGEELLFRGWLMYWFAEGFAMGGTASATSPMALGAALIGSSIAFGLVHPISKLYIVLAAVMGLYFGGLLLWSGNLLVPIAAHASYDAVQLIMTAREQRRMAE